LIAKRRRERGVGDSRERSKNSLKKASLEPRKEKVDLGPAGKKKGVFSKKTTS